MPDSSSGLSSSQQLRSSVIEKIATAKLASNARLHCFPCIGDGFSLCVLCLCFKVLANKNFGPPQKWIVTYLSDL